MLTRRNCIKMDRRAPYLLRQAKACLQQMDDYNWFAYTASWPAADPDGVFVYGEQEEKVHLQR